jgi:hypothetical protein
MDGVEHITANIIAGLGVILQYLTNRPAGFLTRQNPYIRHIYNSKTFHHTINPESRANPELQTIKI